MNAKLVTYTTKNLTMSERSILSKRLYGYLDKSNKSQYRYQRKGLLHEFRNIKVSNNTFIIEEKGWHKINKFLKESKAEGRVWDIKTQEF